MFGSLREAENFKYISLCLIFLLAIGVRVYKIQDKGGYFVDEYLTIQVSNYYSSTDPTPFMAEGEFRTGKELKQAFFGSDNSFSGVLSALHDLRIETHDPHSNLYYSLFKIFLLGADSGNLDEVTKRAFALNLILFIIGFIFLFRLAKLLFPNNTFLIFCTLIVAYLSGFSVENTMYFRPYQLQETLLVIYSFLFTKLMFDIRDGKSIVSWANFLSLSFVSALFILSGYFSIPYAGLLGMILLGTLIKAKGKFNEYAFLFGVLVCTLLLVYTVYPNFFYGIFEHHRGAEVMDTFGFAVFIGNFKTSMLELCRQVKANYISIPLAVVIVLSILVCVFSLRKEKVFKNISYESKVGFSLFLTSLFWIVLIMYVAPFKVARYISPAFPILSLFIPLLCSFFDQKKQRILVVVFSLLFVCKMLSIDELYWERRIPDASYENNQHIPLIVGGVENKWMQVALTPFYTNQRNVYITQSCKVFKEQIDSFDSVYVFIYKNNYNWDAFNKELGDHDVEEDILGGDLGWFYRGFLLKKKEGSHFDNRTLQNEQF